MVGIYLWRWNFYTTTQCCDVPALLQNKEPDNLAATRHIAIVYSCSACACATMLYLLLPLTIPVAAFPAASDCQEVGVVRWRAGRKHWVSTCCHHAGLASLFEHPFCRILSSDQTQVSSLARRHSGSCLGCGNARLNFRLGPLGLVMHGSHAAARAPAVADSVDES